MRVLVCGDRHWTNKKAISLALQALYGLHPEGLHIIDGCAPGADTLAYQVRMEEGYSGERYPADWARYGRAAGPKRNQRMLDEGTPDLVLAFHPNLALSKGTADMVRRAKAAGIPVEVFS